MKPFAESCEENKLPILEILEQELADCREVLEIGSGTGQHAVFFSQQLPHVTTWQTSDLAESHPGIQAWLAEADNPRILPPLELDVCQDHWPKRRYDAVFSANTFHIMSWESVICAMAGIGKILKSGGRFCLYGPFNYAGQYTSDSNARFDRWLKDRDPLSGIRNFEDLDELAQSAGLDLQADHTMPANNRILVWRKRS